MGGGPSHRRSPSVLAAQGPGEIHRLAGRATAAVQATSTNGETDYASLSSWYRRPPPGPSDREHHAAQPLVQIAHRHVGRETTAKLRCGP